MTSSWHLFCRYKVDMDDCKHCSLWICECIHSKVSRIEYQPWVNLLHHNKNIKSSWFSHQDFVHSILTWPSQCTQLLYHSTVLNLHTSHMLLVLTWVQTCCPRLYTCIYLCTCTCVSMCWQEEHGLLKIVSHLLHSDKSILARVHRGIAMLE